MSTGNGWPSVSIPAPMGVNMGWCCPRCSRCYAPCVVMCYTCAASVTFEITSSTSEKIPDAPK